MTGSRSRSKPFSLGRPTVRFSVRVRAAGVLIFTILIGSPLEAEVSKPADVAFFEAKIRPVLIERCYPCHSAGAEKIKGGLRLDSREGMRKGGDSGPAVVPGNLEESLLIQAISYTDAFSKMPPKERLPDPIIADFRAWVRMGAPDPREGTASPIEPAARTSQSGGWWSLRPLASPPVPVVGPQDRNWLRTPIDAFILAGLRAKGLHPNSEADRRTLIRRLYFDLLGLPPKPEEVTAFLRDRTPNAYERLVERVLASPHYGERWARHWMDLVHFAETHGHDQDRIRPNAWPYRDYLIASFNLDKPFARFIEEQIAADYLFPQNPGLVVALGMIAAGPWDESSLRDIRDDSIDRQIGHYIDRDDMVSTVMSSFVSMTVHCSRCHDHKFDPISQKDYYGLQAVFAGVDRADRAYDPSPEVARARRSLEARRGALKQRDRAVLSSLLAPAARSAVATWEAELRTAQADWAVVDPIRMEAAQKTVLTLLPDRSILAQGPRPAQETYTITARPGLHRITAVRLEVLPDERLPSHGPGRNDNGNLHLTEFQLLVTPPSQVQTMKPVPIRRAVADFNQEGWGIEGAVDGNPQTAWGIHPQVGKPHEAVFELAEDVEFGEGTTLTFRLQQTAPANHPIGRLRLSITAAPRPIRILPLPESITAILATPPSRRTIAQVEELAVFHELQSVERQLAALPPRQLVYAAASEFAPDGGHKPPPGPRPVRILKRGDIHLPGELAEPGSLSCVTGLSSKFNLPNESDEGARRAALAKWISDPRNPLTYRSIVNRLWQHHFGIGIVDTPNDFGRMGALPTHPELLDWLASRFIESGGSLKQMHRLIVMSAVYRQSTRHDQHCAEIDSDNRLLWRMNRRRLDAESVHDAILQISGRLDSTMGGPSIRQFALSPGVHVTPVVDYTPYDWDSPGAGRRSVYRFLFRTLPDPFMDQLDEADASQLTAVRNESITPLQALALLNNPFVLRQSEHLAARLETLSPTTEGQILAAYELVLGRAPSSDELQAVSRHARNHGLPNVCRLLYNCNEFLFVN